LRMGRAIGWVPTRIDAGLIGPQSTTKLRRRGNPRTAIPNAPAAAYPSA
jgi:hypothetical protein